MSPLLFITHIFSAHIFTSTREARIIFKAGKNRDGFFDANDLLRQVDKAIDIFEGLTNGHAQGLFRLLAQAELILHGIAQMSFQDFSSIGMTDRRDCRTSNRSFSFGSALI